MPANSDSSDISSKQIEDICAKLVAGGAVHEALPGGGIFAMDHFRPFMCVYRRSSRIKGRTHLSKAKRRT